jgi:hypothetical protein
MVSGGNVMLPPSDAEMLAEYKKVLAEAYSGPKKLDHDFESNPW